MKNDMLSLLKWFRSKACFYTELCADDSCDIERECQGCFQFVFYCSGSTFYRGILLAKTHWTEKFFCDNCKGIDK